VSCNLTTCFKIFNNLTHWSPSEYVNVSMPPYSLNSVYHDFNIRKLMCRTNSFENDFLNQCRIVLLSNQNMSPRLNILLNLNIILLIYRHFKTFFSVLIYFVFIMFNKLCNYGVTSAVLFVYPVTTKNTCIFILSLFLNYYYFMCLEFSNKK